MVQNDHDIAMTGVNDFRLVLPVSEILSINLFDPDVYKRFDAGAPPTTPSGSSDLVSSGGRRSEASN